MKTNQNYIEYYKIKIHKNSLPNTMNYSRNDIER